MISKYVAPLGELAGDQTDRHRRYALIAAAKNSNDCSTKRWTTHQRPKSGQGEGSLDPGKRDDPNT